MSGPKAEFTIMCVGDGGRANATALVLNDVGLNAQGFGLGTLEDNLEAFAHSTPNSVLGVIHSRGEVDPLTNPTVSELSGLAREVVEGEEAIFARAVSELTLY